MVKKSIYYTKEQKIQTIAQYLIVIDHFDKQIADMTYIKNSEKIKNNFLNLIDNGKFSNQKMWLVNKKLSSNVNGLPIAKYDKNNQLITTKSGILNLYEEEYKNRLSLSPPHKGYEELQQLKNFLFKLRVNISKSAKSNDWTEENVLKVCKSLKNNKARDRDGLIYELFKPPFCGSDVTFSITKLFNQIKSNLTIP